MKQLVATVSILAALSCATSVMAERAAPAAPANFQLNEQPAPMEPAPPSGQANQAPPSQEPGPRPKRTEQPINQQRNQTDFGVIRGNVTVDQGPVVRDRSGRVYRDTNVTRDNNRWNNRDRMDRRDRDNWREDRRRFRDRDRDFDAGAAAIGLFTTIIQNERRKDRREMRREMRERRMMDRNDGGTYRCRMYNPDSGRYELGTCWGNPRR